MKHFRDSDMPKEDASAIGGFKEGDIIDSMYNKIDTSNSNIDIDKTKLLILANQILNNHKHLMANNVLHSDYKEGIKVGMYRMIKLIERQ